MFFSLQISELEAKLKDIEDFVGKDKQKLVCKSILIINNFDHIKVITLTDTLFYNGLVSSNNENQQFVFIDFATENESRAIILELLCLCFS